MKSKLRKIMLMSIMLLSLTACGKNKNKETLEVERPYYECNKKLELNHDLIIDETLDSELNEAEPSFYDTYTVINLYYDNDIVKELYSYTKLKFNSKIIYENYSTDEDFMKNKIKKDEELTISFNSETKDMTHAPSGDEQVTKLEEYIVNLKKRGYICEKIK